MKILMINVVCGIRSTGRICTDLAVELEKQGHEVKIAYGRETVPEQFQKYAIRIGNDWDIKKHAMRTRILDEHGFGSKKATETFLMWAEKYNPDLLWLHNIHGYYINVEVLFEWIKAHPNLKVKWTLHDCWAFTGHCTHFSMLNCRQWETHCMCCKQKNSYPSSKWRDNCKNNYDRKRLAFTGVPNMKIITPSRWLAELVKQSFLKEYPVEVRYNVIDNKIFKPTPSNFRNKFGLEGKKIILGVASAWNESKGLSDIIKLAEMLDNNTSCVIVLVGLNRKQIRKIEQERKNILGIERTNNAKELAEIYTAADIFVNPTYEDNYPTVNLEAQACGTYVVTYDTGGCKETIYKDGKVITKNVNVLYEAVLEKIGTKDECRIRS